MPVYQAQKGMKEGKRKNYLARPVVRPAFVRAGSEQSGSSTAADAKNRPEKCVGTRTKPVIGP